MTLPPIHPSIRARFLQRYHPGLTVNLVSYMGAIEHTSSKPE